MLRAGSEPKPTELGAQPRADGRPSGPAAATRTDPTIFAFSLTQPTATVAMVGTGEKTSASPLIQGFRWDVFYLTAQEVAERFSQVSPELRKEFLDFLVSSVTAAGSKPIASERPACTLRRNRPAHTSSVWLMP